jgi:hypothetical protein
MFACRQVVGIQDGVGDPTNACGLPYGTNACAECIATSCCSESAACSADPTCVPTESCLGNCKGDPACRSQCVIDFPSGTAASVAPLSACIASKCEGECNLACGGLAGSETPPDAAAACQSCLTTSACAPAEACASSIDCAAAFQQCALACPTWDCAETCRAAHGAAVTAGSSPDAGPWTSFVQEWSGPCGTACASGGYWSCVGHVGWPAPKSPAVTVAYTGFEYVSHAPVASLNVSVCNPLDLACATPLASGQTNATGTVVLKLQNPPDSNGLGLNGYFQVTSPDKTYMPNIVYWGYPMSEANNPLPMDAYGLNITTIEDEQLAAALGVTVDATRGQVFVNVEDCLFNPAPGVQVTIDNQDPAIREFYGIGNLMPTATDRTGVAIFTNVPVGNVNLTATPVAIGAPSSKVTVQVRAGWITGANLFPTP